MQGVENYVFSILDNQVLAVLLLAILGLVGAVAAFGAIRGKGSDQLAFTERRKSLHRSFLDIQPG